MKVSPKKPQVNPSPLGQLSPGEFLSRIWQREPQVFRNVYPSLSERLDPDELAGIACEPEADARLVMGNDEADSWNSENGPFPEARFSSLPEKNWTLLVQAVDQWLPEVAAVLDDFCFLPRWRLDDVLVSYSVEGGGVGPHFDHYDVFLIQATGTRRWRIGQRCNPKTPLRDEANMLLLRDFDEHTRYDLNPGDMLYLPAGIAHWGTATSNDCITWSVGFRAPSHADLIRGATDILVDPLTEQHRYTDTSQSPCQDPFRIDDGVNAHLATLSRAFDSASWSQALTDAFGKEVTTPRFPSLIDETPLDDADRVSVRRLDAQSLEFEHHPSSRFAYRLTEDRAILYVDGEGYETSEVIAKGICFGLVEASVNLDRANESMIDHLLSTGSLRWK